MNPIFTTKDDIVFCHIIDNRNIGIVRKPKEEPEETELLLVASNWKKPSDLDLTVITDKETLTYYLVKLPAKGTLRPKGRTSIHHWWLATGKAYDSEQEAREAFER